MLNKVKKFLRMAIDERNTIYTISSSDTIGDKYFDQENIGELVSYLENKQLKQVTKFANNTLLSIVFDNGEALLLDRDI